MTLQQKLNTARLEVAALEAQARKEAQIDAIELPGGRIVNLNEAGATQATAQQKASEEDAVKVFESLGIPRKGAEAAAKGREVRGW